MQESSPQQRQIQYLSSSVKSLRKNIRKYKLKMKILKRKCKKVKQKSLRQLSFFCLHLYYKNKFDLFNLNKRIEFSFKESKKIIPLFYYINKKFFLNIEKIEMVGCNLSEIFAKKLCKLIGKDCFPNLVSINLNLNKIGNKGAEYICEMIEKHKLDNLQEIQLQSNQIDKDGIARLFQVINMLWHIKIVGIGRNEVSNNLIILADSLQNNEMEEFYISKSQIGLNGILQISSFAELNLFKYLKCLYIGGNNIQDQGFILLIQVFRKMQKLEKLELSSNGISEMAMISAINKIGNFLPLLKLLDIQNNDITNYGKKYISSNFKKHFNSPSILLS